MQYKIKLEGHDVVYRELQPPKLGQALKIEGTIYTIKQIHGQTIETTVQKVQDTSC